MQPVTADLARPEGHAIPYRWATPGQHAQAVLWLAEQLQHYFLPPAMEVWSEVFHEYQPELWENSNGICLDHADLVRLAQRVARSVLAPDLDPPIYCEAARYLAEGYAYVGKVAAALRADLEYGLLDPTPEVMAIIKRLEVGKAVAERVMQATHR
ncbi:hypothetical protein [Hymenobacter sp. UYCo722]|uniref:hypothetical protein n=1 Tax=Hymenobacter sp. UYCo722 TaxID=3156335 RepID=UPI003397A09F